ncbi:MAG: PEGA domain-containing protein [Deltaproteobacteria bacterium]|nr:PEGA domain-containing protein [Deltaproteobacteria bacterium]
MNESSRGRNRVGIAILFALALAGPAAAQTPASSTSTSAEPAMTEQAKEHFRAAMDFYKDGKFVQALLEFKKAYDLAPRAAITYNIARSYEQLAQWSAAIVAYERFITETTDPREKADALDKIEFLKTKLGDDATTPDGQYKSRIEAGKKAFSRGSYEEAIQEFKAAYDLKPSSGIIFNIAKSYERLARYEEAIDYFQQYLQSEPNAKDKADVEETIKRLKKSIRERFQELYVTSDPPGADIFIDDAKTGLQGQTNYRFKVTPGPHTLFLELNGYEPIKREFVMPDDKPLQLEFKLNKLKNVGYVEVKSNVDGARIYIDGAIVGLTPYRKKKQLEAGPHQIVIEAFGFPRHTEEFVVERDQTVALDVTMEAVDQTGEGDSTAMEDWGRNLLIVGVLGGGLGFGGAFAYQQLVLRRPVYEYLGPSQANWGGDQPLTKAVYWKGLPTNPDGSVRAVGDTDLGDALRENGTANTLRTIQVVSASVGGGLAALGLGLLIAEWVTPEDEKKQAPVVLSANESANESISIDAFGVSPSVGGATVGIMGSF